MLVSCTPIVQPLEFGVEPPEQKSVDFLQVLQYRTESAAVLPRGATFSSGKLLLALEFSSNLYNGQYSPIASSGILAINNNSLLLQSLGEIPSIIAGSGLVANAIASDNVGNYYITGRESNKIILSKYDGLSGQLLWKKTSGGSSKEEGKAIAVDASGNITIGGFFNSVSSSDQRDAYLARYNNRGDLLWSKSIWSSGFDEIHSLKHDMAGNIIVLGVFSGTTCNIDSIKLRSSGGKSMFLASFSPDGSVRWATKADGVEFSSSISGVRNLVLSISNAGEIYVGGTFRDKLTLENITLSASQSMFLARYDANGRVVWAKQAIGSSQGDAMVATRDGAVIAGRFNQQAEFDGFGVRGNNVITLFIGMYGKNGDLRWLKRAGDLQNTENGTSWSQSIGVVAVDNNETIYVAGEHYGDIVIGSTPLQGGSSYSVTYPPNGSRNSTATTSNTRYAVMFLAKIGRK